MHERPAKRGPESHQQVCRPREAAAGSRAVHNFPRHSSSERVAAAEMTPREAAATPGILTLSKRDPLTAARIMRHAESGS